MADGRKNNKGKKGNRGGRPSKAEEQKLIEKLTPLEPKAHQALKNAIAAEEQWAVKLFFEYMYGKPRQQHDVTTGGQPFPTPIIIAPSMDDE